MSVTPLRESSRCRAVKSGTTVAAVLRVGTSKASSSCSLKGAMAGQSKPAAAAAVTYLATTHLDMPKAWAQRRGEWPIDKTCCKIDLILCVLSKGGGMELQKSPTHYRRRSEETTSEIQ